VNARRQNIVSTLILTAAAVAAIAAAPARAQDAAPALSVESVGPLVREYLLANPEVVIEAFEAYQKKQEQMETARQKEGLKTHSDFLYKGNADVSPSVGNPKGDVTIVEFFDYNCGYCKRALQEVQNVLETDKNVRVVFKEMPILSAGSRTAAQWALAAQRQGKYFEFHQKLMAGNPNSVDSLKQMAKDLGMNVEKMEKDAADPAIAAIIDQNLQVAQDLGIRGTPAFVINDQLVGGYIELDQMKQIIAQARAAASADNGKKDGKTP
jgi:protein-disulfide isomerase